MLKVVNSGEPIPSPYAAGIQTLPAVEEVAEYDNKIILYICLLLLTNCRLAKVLSGLSHLQCQRYIKTIAAPKS